MEVHAARTEQFVARRRAAAVGRRRHAVGPREGAGKGLGRPVPGIQSDSDHLFVTGGELVRGALHQQPPAQCARRLAQRRRHQPVEVEPRQVRLAGQLLAVQIRLCEAALDDVEQPLQPVGGDHADILPPVPYRCLTEFARFAWRRRASTSRPACSPRLTRRQPRSGMPPAPPAGSCTCAPRPGTRDSAPRRRRRQRPLHQLADLCVALDEARFGAVARDAEHVVQHQHLAVGARAGADADSGDREPPADGGCDRRRHRLQHQREAARCVPARSRPGTAAARRRPARPCALWPPSAVAVCGVRPMWPMTPMPADTSARTRSSRGAGALELDHVGAAVLEQSPGVGHGLGVGYLVAHERQVADHQRVLDAAVDGRGQHRHLVHCGGHGRLVTEHDVGRRVADQHQVDPGGVDDAPAGVVVGRDHHDRPAVALHLTKRWEREFHGASRTMLSISRVPPKRAAATSSAPARAAQGSNVSGSTTSK